MISTKQKWLLGGLVPLCGAIWLPQILGTAGAGTSAQVGIEGPDEAEMMASMGAPTGTGASGAMAGGSPSRGGAPAAAGGRAPEAASTLGGPDAALQAVVAALGDAEAFGIAAGLTPPEDGEPDRAIGARSAADPVHSPMLAFVESHPLRGTITGSATRLAIFGEHSVTEGSRIPGTSATLARVTRGGVTVDEGGISLEIELPPLKTRVGASTPTAVRADMGGGPGMNSAPMPSAAVPSAPIATTPVEPAGGQ